MEQKLVRAPFNIDMAKKITEKSVKGRIVTRDGRNARIACWNYKSLSGEYPLLVLIENGIFEVQELYTLNGKEKSFIKEACDSDLVLEIPEYLTFKDGDVVVTGDIIVVIRNPKMDDLNGFCFKLYVAYNFKGKSLFYCADFMNQENARLATEEEKQIFVEKLKLSKQPKDKEYLKRFFGIENSPKLSNSSNIGKNEFRVFDRVLVRLDARDVWVPHFFAKNTGDPKNPYSTINGSYWRYCIPYKGNEHLLGTTNNPEDYK